MRSRPFFIEDWLVEPQLNQVSRGEKRIRLAPKFMQVLICLAGRPGEVVTREELMQTVWADTVVVEVVLTRAISKLRSVLGDSAQEPRVIETIPTIGYRLIAPVSAVKDVLPGDAVAADDVVLVMSPGSHPSPRPAALRRRLQLIGGGFFLLVLGVGIGMYALRPVPPPVLALTQALPLTSFPGEEMDPAFSPDGNQVAFSHYKGQPEDSIDIYVRTVASSALTRLTADPATDRNPAWSPDGSVLAYVKRIVGTLAIYQVAATGGFEQKLLELDCACWPSLAWTPDGASLVYTDQVTPSDPDTRGLYLFDLHTQERSPLTRPPPLTKDTYPTFSPDGERLAFVREEKGQGQIHVMALATKEAYPVTRPGFFIEGLDWMAGGDALVFASQGNLWRLDLSKGVPEWLSTTGRRVERPTIAPERRRLVYGQTVFDTNIWRLPVSSTDASAPSRLVASTYIDRAPQISPDGSEIAFLSDRRGHCEVWVSRSDGAEARPVATLQTACMNTMIPRWSPDGNALVFVAYQEGVGKVYRVSAAGGLTQQLTFGEAEDRAPSWASDGQSVYFGSNRGGDWQVWSVSIANGEAAQVTSAGGYVPLEAPDGRFLYFTKPGQVGLWRQAAGGGAEEQVLTTLQPDDATNWRVVVGGVYAINRTAGPDPVIDFWDATTRQVTSLTTIPRSFVSCSQFDIAPDGQWLLYVQIDFAGSDLMLVEPFP